LKPAEWPFPIVELFLGRRTPAAVLDAARDPGERCEAQFYLGQWHLLRDKRADSIEALRKAVEACPKDFNEYAGAVAELKRLGRNLMRSLQIRSLPLGSSPRTSISAKRRAGCIFVNCGPGRNDTSSRSSTSFRRSAAS